MILAREALALLRTGNRRFVDGALTGSVDLGPAQRAAVAKEQAPFAVILGCSDSRVPAEIVFDQGLGDLFVIRVAGNIVAPSQVGSVEFAAAKFRTRLVVVLGHTQCGAIQATLDELQVTAASFSGESELQERLLPTVTELERTLSSLRQMLDTLDQQPNALIFNRDYREDPRPPAGTP